MVDILYAVFAVVFLVMIPKAVEIFPCQVGCLLRSKELINLENSATLARDRDILALVLVVPFCILISKYKVWGLSFMDGSGESGRFLLTLAFFVAYILLHEGLFYFICPRRVSGRLRNAARKSIYTFFISSFELVFVLSSALSLFGVLPETIKIVIIVALSATYLIFFIRKTAIFSSFCNIFETFLYLCALEILPTGLIVFSALFI